MGNDCFKYLNANKLLDMASHRNFCKLVRQEHNQVMEVYFRGTTANFSRKEKKRHIPYWDHSRVITNSRECLLFDEDDCDFSQIVMTSEKNAVKIYANYVDGFKAINKYICTETPMENTWEAFIKLIWEQNSRVVVSLTDLMENNQETYVNRMQVQDSEIIIGEYVMRTLEITKKQNFTKNRLLVTNKNTEISREITNFWLTDWPDRSIPTSLEEFLNLRNEVNREQFRLMMEMDPGPIVVHCSAGAGCTETYCVIDYALEQLNKEGRVSIPQTVLTIISQRHSSNFCLEQYVFCYNVLEHVLLNKIIENIQAAIEEIEL